MAPDPIEEFQRVFERAQDDAPGDPTAFCLATATREGAPAARVLLLKGVDADGFVFFTNYESRKGRELAENPRAAMCFYWHWIHQQVRIEGRVERLDERSSDEYFHSRPRGSQIGAWASLQSQPLPSRVRLLRRYLEAQARWATGTIPRPPHWGGFRLRPERLEFWSDKTYRLHDRVVYRLEGERWSRDRLYP